MNTAKGKWIILLFASFLGMTAWGHSGKIHEEEILSVLGIKQENLALRTRLHPTIEVFSRQIDHDYSPVYRELQQIMRPYIFSWGIYGHRVLFHWGFNTNPRESRALRDCFAKTTTDKEYIDRGFQYIVEEQSRRNRQMLLAIGRLSPASRKHHNAVATIIYNTHIIGDYIEGAPGPRDAMISLEAVVNDVIKHGIQNFDSDLGSKKAFEKAIRQAYRSGGTQQRQAQAVLDVMREHVPKCIENSKIIKRIIYGAK